VSAIDCFEDGAPRVVDAVARGRGVKRGEVEPGEGLGQLDDPRRVVVPGRREPACEPARDQDAGAREDAPRVVLTLERDPALVEAVG